MIRKRLWNAAGFVALALGTAGIPLPLLPTVPFYLLAAFCFARGNSVWEQWLVEHPRYGHHIRAWRDGGIVSRYRDAGSACLGGLLRRAYNQGHTT